MYDTHIGRLFYIILLYYRHETTNGAISFALYELAQNQDLQDQLRQEVRQVFHSLSPEDECPTDMPGYDDINRLPLLSNVFKETLRCYSSVPFGAKIAEKDFVWNNKVFTKGTRFLVSSLVNHFDKSQWGDDCDQYIPSRWDCTPAKNIGQYAYFPFGSGRK
jgi:cytochrome P450